MPFGLVPRAWRVALYCDPVDDPVDETELVVLLDESFEPCGTMAKSAAHHENTPLHLAFSAYLFDADGRFLVTRRAVRKSSFGGIWTNSCCGHPGPGEDLADAAARRIRSELGLGVRDLRLALPRFRYQAVSADGVRENELCPVFIGHVDTDPTPDRDEVEEWRWVDWEAFCDLAMRTPWAISPWAAEQVPLLRELSIVDG
jgi:isopentenyl-diphosphate delta-isomerase